MVLFYAAALITFCAFVGAGVLAGRGTSSSRDFSLGGRKSSAAGVTGILLGALVGGASTVGTVQMAYSCGITAWWFTLGGGIGCLILGLRFAAPLRAAGITTVSDYLIDSYGGGNSFFGRGVYYTATVSATLGTFISVGAQFLACIALLSGLFPLSVGAASALTIFLVLGFIATGGLKSFSKLGEAKILLLYFVLLCCGVTAALRGGSWGAVTSALGFQPWFNLFGKGGGPELGSLASMIVGVFTTQIYIQSLAAAKDAATARKGAFASALLMPPMGLLGVWVGLSVRARGVELPPAQVLSWFIRDSFPPLLGGVIWGGIVITVIGCASGLVLGMSTNIVKNLLPQGFMERHASRSLSIQRIVVLLIVLAAAAFGMGGSGSMILEWSYLSMGLRGAGTFLPFVAAILAPGALDGRWAFFSSVGGLAGTLAWAFAGFGGDPLFAGLAISAACVIYGLRTRKR